MTTAAYWAECQRAEAALKRVREVLTERIESPVSGDPESWEAGWNDALDTVRAALDEMERA